MSRTFAFVLALFLVQAIPASAAVKLLAEGYAFQGKIWITKNGVLLKDKDGKQPKALQGKLREITDGGGIVEIDPAACKANLKREVVLSERFAEDLLKIQRLPKEDLTDSSEYYPLELQIESKSKRAEKISLGDDKFPCTVRIGKFTKDAKSDQIALVWVTIGANYSTGISIFGL
jgi:hypothetical protein